MAQNINEIEIELIYTVGLPGPQGDPGVGVNVKGTLALYSDLSSITNPQPNDAYYVKEDKQIYVFNGSNFPAQGDGIEGNVPYIGVNENWWIDGVDIGYPSRGETGVSITDISLTNSSAYRDTYTITMSDGSTYIYYVDNGVGLNYNWLGTQLGIKREDEANYTYVDLKGDTGRGIIDVVYSSSLANVDTYTINYTDSTQSTFDVTNAKQVELYRVGNEVRWGYVGDSAYTTLLNTIELGTAQMTYAQRIALTGVIDGAKVFQTDGAKGEYQYVSGKWYFIGNKLTKQISSQYYTLQVADIGYLLEFTLDVPSIEVEVTIPNGVFADAHIIDMIQGGASKVKFIAGSGVTLNVDSVYPNQRTYSKFAEAKLRFKSASDCVLVGGLE